MSSIGSTALDAGLAVHSGTYHEVTTRSTTHDAGSVTKHSAAAPSSVMDNAITMYNPRVKIALATSSLSDVPLLLLSRAETSLSLLVDNMPPIHHPPPHSQAAAVIDRDVLPTGASANVAVLEAVTSMSAPRQSTVSSHVHTTLHVIPEHAHQYAASTSSPSYVVEKGAVTASNDERIAHLAPRSSVALQSDAAPHDTEPSDEPVNLPEPHSSKAAVASTALPVVPAQDMNGKIVRVGDRVEARFNRGARFRVAVIAAICDGTPATDLQPTFTLHYDDGDVHTCVAGNIRKAGRASSAGTSTTTMAHPVTELAQLPITEVVGQQPEPTSAAALLSTFVHIDAQQQSLVMNVTPPSHAASTTFSPEMDSIFGAGTAEATEPTTASPEAAQPTHSAAGDDTAAPSTVVAHHHVSASNISTALSPMLEVEDEEAEEDQIRDMDGKPVTLNSRVVARFRGKSMRMYGGTVSRIDLDTKAVSIDYDDGDRDVLQGKFIRVEE